MTTETQFKNATRPPVWRRVMLRVVTVLCAMFCMGVLLHRISAALDRGHHPAGFLQGMLQGALMPAAWPNLIVGNDVTIYAQNNTGLGYKLGYTVGVNVCGAVFFGMFFWRLNRWRNKTDGAKVAAAEVPSAESCDALR